MSYLIITDLTDNSEILTDYSNLTRKKRVNGERSLSFFISQTVRNLHSFPMVSEESIVEYEGEKYRIKHIEERTISETPVKSVRAVHVFFDIVDVFQYNVMSPGTKSINEVMSFVLNGTGWTFSVIDSFGSVTFDEDEEFGNDTSSALFQRGLELFEAEFDPVDTEVKLRTQIGSKPDFQFRFKHNVKTLSRSVNSNDLSTYIKGYGKKNEDGTYTAEVEYTSPMAAVYGLRHAPPVRSESITDPVKLLEAIKRAIIDNPEVSIKLEFIELKNGGFTVTKPGLGDTVPTICDPLNVDIDLRIIEIEDYPESHKSPQVFLSNVQQSFADVNFDRSKSILDKIWDENSGKLRYNVYDERVKQMTELLNNTLTELEYPPNMGIIARDPNDPNKFVAVRSSGIGVTTNGGLTFDEAITSLGINTSLLTAGQIKTNNIQIIGEDDLFYWDGTQLIAIDANDPNKFVKLRSGELHIAKGAIKIERPDGGLLIEDGLVKMDFAVMPTYPADLINTSQGTRHYVSERSVAQNDGFVGLYTFRKTARYLEFEVALSSSTVSYAAMFKVIESGTTNQLGAIQSYESLGNETVKKLRIDMGVPDFSEFAVRALLLHNYAGATAYCRIIRIRQTDF